MQYKMVLNWFIFDHLNNDHVDKAFMFIQIINFGLSILKYKQFSEIRRNDASFQFVCNFGSDRYFSRIPKYKLVNENKGRCRLFKKKRRS